MKIICIGRNYPEHAEELGNEKPESPVVFLKPDTAKLQRRFPFYIPSFSDQIHHEVEVVVKINRIGKYIEKKFAGNYALHGKIVIELVDAEVLLRFPANKNWELTLHP